ncbi:MULTISPECIES: GrlR family regulatory protein [Achromobacter]|jgi:hypothetical protein|uniref:GrlR family regulatory protein n=1 Tax=Achromobacter TaxID=222 RepID=UPI00146897DF|nr:MULTISPECIES: GrlR family regulatory protein [Achromobacter]WPQ35100.1 GrlR family regulatory protein [Achromobacter xylosoxidans]CAB3870501.1 hypothetical protein LMG3412_02728 [Achromobacter deleyi]
MIDGLWHIRYVIAGKECGGVIVVKDGKALGGDGGFIFTGTLHEDGKNVVGELHVRQVMKSVAPVIPGLTDYKLKLIGNVSGNTIDIVGEIPSAPGVSLRINATRHAE